MWGGGGGGGWSKNPDIFARPRANLGPRAVAQNGFWSIFRVLGVDSFLCLSEEKRDRADAADARGAACFGGSLQA